MKNIIATKDIRLLRYLLGSPISAPEYYKQIRASFPNDDVDKMFAEPIMLDGGLTFAWSSAYPGKAVQYTALSQQDKNLAVDMLNTAVAKLINAVETFKDPKLVDIFRKCIEIPGQDSIYIVNSPDGPHVVITQWGFIQDFPDAQKGILIEFSKVKNVPMTFHVVYSDDNSPAANEQLVFDVNQTEVSAVSDSNGVVVLEKVRVGSFVRAYEAADMARLSPQDFTCVENGVNTIKVTPKSNMIFQIVDQNGVPQSNRNFLFEYEGNKVSSVSNADGLITLEHIKNGVQVEAYMASDSGEKQYDNVFVFDRHVNPYRIEIHVELPPPVVPEAPKTSNMRIKVVDDKGNVLKKAPVVVRYLGKKEVLVTDDNGFVQINDLPVGTVVEAEPK